MLYLVSEISQKDQYVVVVDEARLEADHRKDEVQAALESGWKVSLSEAHENPTEITKTSGDSRLGTVLFVNMRLPLYIVSFKRGVHG